MTPRNKKEGTPKPFPKPRTFPSGWDGTALVPYSGQQAADKAPIPNQESSQEKGWTPEKFPKPRTFPKNWSIDD